MQRQVLPDLFTKSKGRGRRWGGKKRSGWKASGERAENERRTSGERADNQRRTIGADLPSCASENEWTSPSCPSCNNMCLKGNISAENKRKNERVVHPLKALLGISSLRARVASEKPTYKSIKARGGLSPDSSTSKALGMKRPFSWLLYLRRQEALLMDHCL